MRMQVLKCLHAHESMREHATLPRFAITSQMIYIHLTLLDVTHTYTLLITLV